MLLACHNGDILHPLLSDLPAGADDRMIAEQDRFG